MKIHLAIEGRYAACNYKTGQQLTNVAVEVTCKACLKRLHADS
jgi:hypothetical protein